MNDFEHDLWWDMKIPPFKNECEVTGNGETYDLSLKLFEIG